MVNRTGNRPSHEQAAVYFDRAIALCRKAGFRKIRLRGDTDFTQTEHLDRWDAGRRAVHLRHRRHGEPVRNRGKPAGNAWKELKRRRGTRSRPSRASGPENVKEQIVEAREFEDIRLVKEHVAEFTYRPGKCRKDYRVVVVWKDLEVSQGQQKLFDELAVFLLHHQRLDKPSEEIVFGANDRCNQENLLEQLKSGVRALTAPGGQPDEQLGLHGDGLAWRGA